MLVAVVKGLVPHYGSRMVFAEVTAGNVTQVQSGGSTKSPSAAGHPTVRITEMATILDKRPNGMERHGGSALTLQETGEWHRLTHDDRFLERSAVQLVKNIGSPMLCKKGLKGVKGSHGRVHWLLALMITRGRGNDA